MKNRWSDTQAQEFVDRYAAEWGKDLALRTYTARLLGSEKSLVLHGGGNTSVKSAGKDLLGRRIDTINVKASGSDLSVIEPEEQPALDLACLKELMALDSLADHEMVNEIRTRMIVHASPFPSIETLVHAFISKKYIDHTHSDTILALTNQEGGEAVVREALGDEVSIINYVTPGFELAKAAAAANNASPGKRGQVWMHHGLVTWGDSAQEAYESMIEFVSRAEEYIAIKSRASIETKPLTAARQAFDRWTKVAPVLRGLLAEPAEDPDNPFERVILAPLINDRVLEFVDSENGKKLALSPPLTSDHLIRTKAFPLWIDSLDYNDVERFKSRAADAINRYRDDYLVYLNRHAKQMDAGVTAFNPSPKVVLMPGMGAVCAGRDAIEAGIARDITAQTLDVKTVVGSIGRYEGLGEKDLYCMEYRGLQHAKLGSGTERALGRSVALVTGAAGAIGSGICRSLLESGCHVAVTDLAGKNLDSMTEELKREYGARVIGVPIDVTDQESISTGFNAIVRQWGGIDIIVVNAGIALVSSLEKMELEAFAKLERVNIEGTLLLLRQAARFFRIQGTGGDVVLVSTKNVFSPGAGFGAYSATKAASHQLARIASLEMAELGVRVNMVSPDAVFSDGPRKSGLWAEVGPDRMKARGLDEKGLEEYYRGRNLLKAKITAEHVGRAVLFFATRQTPTTGATIPVDGGLPDSTPR